MKHILLLGWFTLLTLICALPAVAEDTKGQWLDVNFQPVSEEEAIYKLAEYEAIEGGYAVQINHIEGNTVRFKGQVKELDFENLVPFGEYTLYRTSGEILETGFYNDDGQRHGTILSYQEDGQLMREMPFKKGRLHGLYLTYSDGVLVSEQEVQDGQRHGRTMRYYETGEKRMESFFENGTNTGIRRTWSENGQLVAKTPYENGKIHGTSYQYFEDGSLRRQSNHHHGNERGKQLIYSAPGQKNRYRQVDDNGNTIEERRYNNDGQVMQELRPVETQYGDGSQTVFYTSEGNISQVREESHDRQWALVQRYDDEGSLIERSESVDNQPYGEFVTRRWNLTEHGTYKNGKRHGSFHAVNSEGEVVTEGHYHYGQKIGEWDEFDGHTRRVENYDDQGNLHGERREYSSSGALISLNTYHHGEQHGPAKTYSDGKLRSEGQYHHGKRHGEWVMTVSWGSNDMYHGHYENDIQVGVWTTYDQHGHKMAIEQYNHEGQLHNRQFRFNHDGALDYVIEYKNGIRHGYTTYYYNGQQLSQEHYNEGYLSTVLEDDEMIELQ